MADEITGTAGQRRCDQNASIVLEISDVSKTFQPSRRGESPLQTLDRISLTVNSAEFVSVIGPSGCGKSTLLNLIAGLDGEYDGEIVHDSDPGAVRLGKIAYMHQRDLLLPWRTVLDNAALSLEISGASAAEARSSAFSHLDAFGLTEFAGAYPAEISGGMRQRVALLRSILPGGNLILLDEPFGALDALTRRTMHDWLTTVTEVTRRAVLLVTHDIEEALVLSDRVYVLSERPGRIVNTVEVRLSRPRRSGIVSEPEFVQLKSALIESLMSPVEVR
jgi:ABC-type nitrate/sulfonate/bicarbonate transport system ATPase subunit